MQSSSRHHQQTNTQLLTSRMPFLSPNQQCHGTEGTVSVPSIPRNLPITWKLVSLTLKHLTRYFWRCSAIAVPKIGRNDKTAFLSLAHSAHSITHTHTSDIIIHVVTVLSITRMNYILIKLTMVTVKHLIFFILQ